MKTNKGIVINLVCTNSACSYNEGFITKEALNSSSTGKHSFSTPKVCPRCESEIELISFVSGTMEIVEDKIN
jgi:primosomal protein N'